MFDDIFNNFEQCCVDDLSSENILFPEEMDIHSDSLLPSAEEVILDVVDNSIESLSGEAFAFDAVDVGEHSIESPSVEGISTSDAVNLAYASQQLSDLFVPDNQWDINEFDGLGNPVEHSQYWQQQNGQYSCAVVAQSSIFESITGTPLDEAKACEIAEQNGWFDPEIGTHPDDVGKLLNKLGIPTEQKYNANLEDIANALEKGDRVIVGLDGQEIWQPMRDANGVPIEQTNAGHAVWVTGIDTQPDGSVKIILNDSGSANGKMAVIDAIDFLNSWEDHGNFLVVADAPEHNTLA